MRRPALQRLWSPPWRAFVACVRHLPTPRLPRWALYTALALTTIGAVGSLLIFLFARSSVKNLEERYHASISFGAVLPCGFGVCVRDARVRFDDAPGLALSVPRVRFRPASKREPRSIELDGLEAAWTGQLAEVETQARALAQRFEKPPQNNAEPKARSHETSLHVKNASLVWQAAAGGESVKAQGVDVEKVGADIRVFAEQVRGSLQQRSLLLTRGRTSLRRQGASTRFVSAEAHELHLESVGAASPAGVPSGANADSSAAPKGALPAPGGGAPRENAPTAGPGGAKEGQAGEGAPGRSPTGEEAPGPAKRRGGAKKAVLRGAKVAAEALRAGVNGPESPIAGAEPHAEGGAGGGLALLDKARVLREVMPELRRVLAQVEAVAVEDAKVSVDAFYATFVRGGVTVHLGPNAITAFRAPSAFRLDVTPQVSERGPTALKLGVEVPVDPAADLKMSLTGGPVPLAALGLRRGDLGLLDVEHSMVEADITMRLTGDGHRASAEVDAKLHDLSVEHRALSSEPVRGAELRLRGDVNFETDGSSLVVEKGELGVGRVGVTFSGALRRPGSGWALRGRVEVPATPCQAGLDALPAGLTPLIAGTRMDGHFALVTAVDFDSSKPDDADVHFSLGNGCKVTSVPPEIDVKKFRTRFRRRVYGPNGERVEVEMGPGAEGWVPYGAISPFMTAAVLTTEDGGFRYHHGFDAGAIRNSIRDNLREGRFLRGASTISMQTVKNLYLEREKTLGRKIQEAVLTVYLEQALAKEDILELYFNCIEFGPMLYGIGPAAGHYFRSSPRELSVGQALFLSSILPSPKVGRFGPDGRLKAGWMGYLRKLMQIMMKRHLIDETELRLATSEWLVFGEPAPVREDGGDLDSVDEVYPAHNGP